MDATKDQLRTSRWLDDARQGRKGAMDALLPVVYAELKRVAHAYMRREFKGRTLQTTALVNEAYLRLLGEQHVSWQNRAHFCAIAAGAMRQILIERARERNAQKRGGGASHVTIDERIMGAPARDEDVEALDEALERLAARDPRRARVVELKYFGGNTFLHHLDEEKAVYSAKQRELEALRVNVEDRIKIARDAVMIWAQSHRNLGQGIAVPPLVDIGGIAGGVARKVVPLP